MVDHQSPRCMFLAQVLGISAETWPVLRMQGLTLRAGEVELATDTDVESESTLMHQPMMPAALCRLLDYAAYVFQTHDFTTLS